MMIGLFESKAAAWNVNRIPDHFSFGEGGSEGVSEGVEDQSNLI